MLKHKQKWNLPLYHLLLYHWMKKLVVNDHLLSWGHYKLMKKSNVASAVAKGIFHPLFLDWIVLPRHQVSKKLAAKKIIYWSKGTLLVEHSTMKELQHLMMLKLLQNFYKMQLGWVGCYHHLHSLQHVARKLEKKGELLGPFQLISADFGEGVEFDSTKTTCLALLMHLAWVILERRDESISAHQLMSQN